MKHDYMVLRKDRWHFFLDGKEVAEEVYRARYPRSVAAGSPVEGNRPWAKPVHSDALAVHPSQIPAAMARNAAHGLHVDYDADGCPILGDREQKRRLCQIEGAYDKDGGYGDAQRGSTPAAQIPNRDVEIAPDVGVTGIGIRDREEFIRMYREEEARQCRSR